MRVDAEAMPDSVICKPGTFDDKDVLGGLPMMGEIYTKDRPDCFSALGDVKQTKGAA